MVIYEIYEGIHPEFETQDRHHQNSKARVSWESILKNSWYPQIFFKNIYLYTNIFQSD